jgi:hypothetical protein
MTLNKLPPHSGVAAVNKCSLVLAGLVSFVSSYNALFETQRRVIRRLAHQTSQFGSLRNSHHCKKKGAA